ncbi:DUF2007 domain-containing protein [uncultured Desulfuromusa sp.]|uniref:putative signal transducing protein n=1 Tax=uncultured Desulfuromusa sp. TaxID=219183 RepID=UPI002AA86304|nr:DUF2007 domain-containing protein [uncultured Desulfuromusa sp.]
MKKLHVFNYWDRSQAALIQEILAHEGIQCILKNDQLSSALGEIPFLECYPELWVVDDDVFPRAQLFLHSWLKNDACPADSWTCPSCGEDCDAQFGACWACGFLREE